MMCNSIVSIKNKSGEYITVHCCYDGNPEHIGIILCNSIKNDNFEDDILKNDDLNLILDCNNIIHHHSYFDVIDYFLNGSIELIDYLYVFDNEWEFISSYNIMKKYNLRRYLLNK